MDKKSKTLNLSDMIGIVPTEKDTLYDAYLRWEMIQAQTCWTEIDIRSPGIEKRWSVNIFDEARSRAIRSEHDDLPECFMGAVNNVWKLPEEQKIRKN